MSIEIKELVDLARASEKYKISQNDILFKSLDSQLSLYYLSPKSIREALIPCVEGTLHHAAPGQFIHQYQPLMDKVTYVDVQIAQPLRLNQQAIKELLVSRQFNEVELYRELAQEVDGVDFWKTERELHDWDASLPGYDTVTLDQIQVSKFQLEELLTTSKKAPENRTDKPSATALKVIGLLMYHLAKSPKYASGKNPNKSQVKELLLELAIELDVNNYGLSKVDERLLAEAMKHLETQKN
jgi:hypothetical protein